MLTNIFSNYYRFSTIEKRRQANNATIEAALKTVEEYNKRKKITGPDNQKERKNVAVPKTDSGKEPAEVINKVQIAAHDTAELADKVDNEQKELAKEQEKDAIDAQEDGYNIHVENNISAKAEPKVEDSVKAMPTITVTADTSGGKSEEPAPLSSAPSVGDDDDGRSRSTGRKSRNKIQSVVRSIKKTIKEKSPLGSARKAEKADKARDKWESLTQASATEASSSTTTGSGVSGKVRNYLYVFDIMFYLYKFGLFLRESFGKLFFFFFSFSPQSYAELLKFN